ncbi:sensor histidine kinase [Streptococcus himalayensis]|uniref:histidine kinase n=1 Tax=Streptococcus himalayensis TaxID=1888195 RepID=A0A917A712_9STRE|nr:sensor histidine kinase [Streptococcus himalayensis]GGE31948.1 histidine kinase [Streptococcus himalayensis]
MTREEKWLFAQAYLKKCGQVGFYLVLMYGSFGLFLYLFETSRTVLGYLLLILTILGGVFWLIDLVFSYQRFKKYALYQEESSRTPMERLLSERIASLEKEKAALQLEEQKKRNDLLDYYTLWVHQIKTPIAAGQLLVQSIENRELKGQMEQELFKIDSYTNLVLQYLRLESFHDDLVVQQENLESMVKEVVKKYALFFIRQGLSLDLHDLEVAVVTDRKWFLVILEQILSNSLKYTKTGGIEIYAENGVLYLKDTGIGIQNSDSLRVFERGFSGYNGRLTQQSSGLGLYLSKKIADSLGHSLSLTSTIGQGTTVMISFARHRLVFE